MDYYLGMMYLFSPVLMILVPVIAIIVLWIAIAGMHGAFKFRPPWRVIKCQTAISHTPYYRLERRYFGWFYEHWNSFPCLAEAKDEIRRVDNKEEVFYYDRRGNLV